MRGPGNLALALNRSRGRFARVFRPPYFSKLARRTCGGRAVRDSVRSRARFRRRAGFL